MAARERALGLDRLPLSNAGRCAQVYRTQQPFTTGDLSKDPDELPGLWEGLGIRSVMMVPLQIGATERRAVLTVSSARVDAFDERDLAFTKALARWIGVVAHRAELVERMARAAREEGRRGAAEEIVTVVAHDLRNYVGPVLGRIQLLKGRAVREGRERDQHDAEAAERALRRVTALVADMLDVARIDQGLFDLAPIPLDLVALVTEAGEALSAPEKKIVVKAPGEAVINGDPARLRQAFENLLANSLKHAQAGTAVSVEIAPVPTGSRIEVTISNSGPPIPRELMPTMFDRFVRGRGSTGLGLGLYLAREIVVAHGGTVSAEPLVDGARFRVRLPMT
jgi:signal transduction histidine kinase